MAEKLYFDSSAANLSTEVESDPTIATPSNVKESYLFKDAVTREPLVGTMPINEAQNIKINPKCAQYADDTYTIPKGYHDGTGKVYVGNLKEYTPGTAAPDLVAYGKVFWSNGERLVGQLDIGSVDQHGTATAADIAFGKTAWVERKQITGTIPQLARKDKTLLAGESYTFPYGISAGTTIISAASLASQTEATAEASDIISGKTAWVNGEKVTGSLDIFEKIKEELAATDALQSQVLYGKKFYSSKYEMVVAGTMEDHTGEETRTIEIGSLYAIPAGYYDGQSSITTKTLAEATVADAKAADVLNEKTAWVNGIKVTGTMPYNTESTTSLDAGATFTIPLGYHTGKGKVTCKTIEEQTQGTAVASDISLNKTAWVNGTKITGTMQDISPISKELLPGEIYYIQEGHHQGSGNVWTKSLKDATAGTATADTILAEKIAWVNGEKVTGTMANNESLVTTLLAGESYVIPIGYHSGTGKVKAESLAVQTSASAVAKDIVNNKTAWVNGEKITGTLVLSGSAAKGNVMEGYTFYNLDTSEKLTGTLRLEGNVKEEDVLYGKSFYSTDPQRIQTGTMRLSGTAIAENVLAGTTFYNTNPKYLLTGSMTNVGQVIKEIQADETYIIPKGYHDGTGTVKGIGLSPQTEGTAAADDIIKDKTAWVNGEKITGILDLDGTATPELVVYGYSYYSNNPKQKLVGTMPLRADQINVVAAGESYTIPQGYHTGNGMVVGQDLASQTEGTATASDILAGKTAWVNGSKIAGTIVSQSIKLIRIAAGNDVTLPAGMYPEGITIYSIYTDRLDLRGTDAYVIETSLYPNTAGYVDEENNTLVITAELR